MRTLPPAHRVFVRSSLWSILVQAVGILATTVATVLLARILGAEHFGKYSFILSAVMILVVPAQVGMPILVLRETARLTELDSHGQVRRLWLWSVLILAVSSLLTTFLALSYFAISGWPNLSQSVVLAAILLVFIYAFSNTRAAAIRGLGRIVLSQVPDVILRPVLLVLLVLAVFYPSGKLGLESAIWLHLVAGTIALVAGLVVLWRCVPSNTGNTNETPMSGKLLLASLILGLASSLQMTGEHIVTFVLGAFGEQVEVADLRVAILFSALAGTGLNVLNMVLAPRIASLYAAGSIGELRTLVALSARLSFAASLFVAIVLAAFGDVLVIMLFGIDYAGAHQLLLIIIIGQLVNAGLGPTGLMLNMCGHEKSALGASLVGLIAGISLSLILVPLYGSYGAASAFAVSMIIWNLHMYIKVHQLLRIDSSFLGRHPTL